jgi:transposase
MVLISVLEGGEEACLMSATMTEVQGSMQAGPVQDISDPQVRERARRRTHTAKYKRGVSAEYEACDRGGAGRVAAP